ncbi:MAG: AzlC family ABC transporter permease [Methanobrevibacter sp.]|uniref:AzlC family ABC transporter permease n=1 Tax=Methanobrevibacter sp. TaxID=66852 RepID=UPI0025D0C759|nr:AzlC family ABC transporter permease [Methanobrevibacter sp.]MBR0270430.1 AzlC family ABC transporter permease [Methanobrevibacter sp.]
MDKFLFGCKSAIPIAFGYIPMGIGYAALALKAGFNPFQTVSFSVLVYAGAGEIIAATMLANGATALAIILTNFVVNLRYMVMNTAVYNKMSENSLLTNILTAHLVTDETFAIFSFENESSVWFYTGLSMTSWLSWILGAAIGVFVLDFLPVIVTNSFNISLYALFIAILVPAVKNNKRLGLLVVITAILNVILQFVVGNWSLIISTLLGALIGMYIVDDEDMVEGVE